MKVDLHLHSAASDGKFTPQEVVYQVFYNHYSSDIITKLLLVTNVHRLVLTGGSGFHVLDGEPMGMQPEVALLQESVEQLFTLVGKDLELEKFIVNCKIPYNTPSPSGRE